MPEPLKPKSLPPPVYEGKIRKLYPATEKSFIMVSTDKVSAFDVVFRERIEDKGKILNQLSCLWRRALEKSGIFEKYNFTSHFLSDDHRSFPPPYCDHPELAGRSVHIKKTQRIDFECIVRGYLAGSAWKEYEKSRTICGEPVLEGEAQDLAPLGPGDKLASPIFTPSTKAEVGEHDRNVSYKMMEEELGKELSTRLREISLAIYNYAAEKMEQCGILLADTKLEFGLDYTQDKKNGQITLIDEVLTPDSSRYWRKAEYLSQKAKGKLSGNSLGKIGFDKQYIRDYVEGLDWDKTPPPPPLEAGVLRRTGQLYREIQKNIEKVLI